MKFSEVVGQEDVKERLLMMVEEVRVPHALMFCGATGNGTLALALAFASYLLGEREEGTNLNTQAMLSKFQHPDLHFIFPVIRPKGTPSEKKITSDDFIHQWCDLLRETVYFSFEEWLSRMKADNQQALIFAAEGDVISHKLSLKSSQGGYKICIIWLPERMNSVFANKMLKLLEEPPQETLFILVSEEPQMLLETIRSRTQRIDVKRISDEAIENSLIRQRGLDAITAKEVARMARGNWLKAVEMINSEGERREFHELFVLLMRLAYKRDIRGMKEWTESVVSLGREKQRRFLSYISEQIRENFACNFSRPELVYLIEEEKVFSKNFARFISEKNVVELQNLIDRVMVAIGQNANPKMQFFDFALQVVALVKR